MVMNTVMSVEEMDKQMGRLRAKLEELKIDKNTLIIFTSDNGPWLPFKDKAGTSGPLRGGKNETWEGGTRVPFIAYWPGKIKAQSSTELVTAMDMMPTLAAISGYDMSQAPNKIDGINVWPVFEKGESSKRESFLYYTFGGKLDAIRTKEWKYFINTNELYNLRKDISEKWDVSAKNKKVCEELEALALKLDAELKAEQRAVGISVPKGDFKDGDIIISSKDAKISGKGSLGLEKPLNNLAFWSSSENIASWQQELKAGKYEVLLFYATVNKNESEYTVTVNEQKLVSKVQSTKAWQNYKTFSVGQVTVDKDGKQTISIQMTDKKKAALFNLLNIVLRPISE